MIYQKLYTLFMFVQAPYILIIFYTMQIFFFFNLCSFTFFFFPFPNFLSLFFVFSASHKAQLAYMYVHCALYNSPFVKPVLVNNTHSGDCIILFRVWIFIFIIRHYSLVVICGFNGMEQELI